MFSLRHAAGSPEEAKFLKDAMVLADIPGVEKFEQLRQVSREERLCVRLLNGVRLAGRIFRL